MKDPLASRPLSESDIPLILSRADQMVVHHRDRTEDPKFMGRLLRFLLAFGPHISVLSGGWRYKTGEDKVRRPSWYSEPLSSQDFRSEGGDTFLVWRRPKTGRVLLVPVPTDMMLWLPSWLDQPRWTNRWSYNAALTALEKQLGREGRRIKLTPSRFRHTAAVRLLKLGMLAEDVQELLGIAPATMKHYVNRTTEEIARDLRSKGW